MAIGLTAVSGCARLVVLDAEAVRRHNDDAWQLRAAPVAGAAAGPGAPPVAATGNPPGIPAGPNDQPGREAFKIGVTSPAPDPVSPLPSAIPASASLATGPALVPRAVLETPRDPYGIPLGLYDRDPILGSHLQVMKARTSSHRTAGAGTVVLGLVVAGLSGVLFWRASLNAAEVTRAKQNGQTVTNDPSGTQYALGVIDAALALGLVTFGVVECATPSDPSALRRYSRETYGAP
jgi:hypothetical protein